MPWFGQGSPPVCAVELTEEELARSIDHIVLPVDSLAGAARTMQDLGFSVTPRAEHPWGTANRLVQFDGVFLEYVEIANEAAFPQSLPPTAFSFAHYNRDWHRKHGEGAAMLVLTSEGAARDRATFLNIGQNSGLTVHDPFDFERVATLPDGEQRKVAFSLTFVSHPELPEIGFFTCDHHYPENFWKPDYQRHDNGAYDLAGIVIVADEPSDHHVMMSSFIGERDMRSTSFGIEIDAQRHRISMLTPIGFERLYGVASDRAGLGTATIAAMRILVRDLQSIAGRLHDLGIEAKTHNNRLIVPSGQCHGCALIFEQNQTDPS